MSRSLINKEPWPQKGIEEYNHIDDGPWGYLLTYDDGTFQFDETQTPTKDEILRRWGSRIKSN